MTATWPAKTDYATGDVLSAANMNAIGEELNDLYNNPPASTTNFYAGKNKIINGDFGINQRSFTSSTTNDAYTFDRWQQANSGGTQTITPQTFTAGSAPVSGYESKNFVRIVTAGQSAATDYSAISQKIESVRTLAGQTATISVWAKASTGTPKIGLGALQYFGTGGSPSASVIVTGTTATISTSWTRYSLTVSIPSISGKTLGTTNDGYLKIDLWTSAGTTISGAGYPAVGVQNVTIDFWGVQLEAGSTATPFQTATGTIQGELAACQRYYQRSTVTNPGYIGAYGAANTTAQAQIPLFIKSTMRVAPTSVDYANLSLTPDGVGTGFVISSIALPAQQDPNSIVVVCNASGLTQYRPYQIYGNAAGAYLGINAEL